MRTTYLLPLLLLPGLAAADNRGELAFNRACAGCHVVPGTSAGKQAARGAKSASAPKHRELQLATLLKTRTPAQLAAWLQAPQKVRPDARCDTRLLAASEVDALLSYLAVSAQPPAPSREEMLRQDLRKQLAERQKQRRQADDTSSHPQGKK